MADIGSGSNVKIALKKQSAFGTLASGNWLLAPAFDIDLKPSQGFDRQALIGLGRQPLRPARDVETVQGSITVPVDLRYIGHWLTALLGAPSTAGGGSPYTHTWTTSPLALPPYSIELQLPDLGTPAYVSYRDVMVDKASFSWAATGFPRLSLQLIATVAAVATSSVAGTPTSETLTPFTNLQNFVKKDGSNWGKILEAGVEYGNGLDAVRYLGGAGQVGDISPGSISMTGSIRMTVPNTDSMALAAAATLVDLQLGWDAGASAKLTVELEQVELGKTAPPVRGGSRIELMHELSPSWDQVEGKAMTVTLINDQSTY